MLYALRFSSAHSPRCFFTPAVTVVLVLGGANTAGAIPYEALSGEVTIPENISYSGHDGRVALAEAWQSKAGTLNFTGDIISMTTSLDSTDAAYILHAAGYLDAAPPVINIGSADDYAESVTLDASNSGVVRTVLAAGYTSSVKNPKGGRVNIYADTLSVKANSSADGAYGLFVQNSTNSASTTDVATININAGQTFIDVHSDIPESAYALVALFQGRLNIEGDLYINTNGGTGMVLTTRGNAATNINMNSTGTVQLNGDIVFEFVESSGTPVDSTVIVNLTNDRSYWNGNTRLKWWSDNPIDPNNLIVTQVTLNLENGATWIPTSIPMADDPTIVFTGDSYTPLNYLNLQNGNILLNSDVNVLVDNLQGSGTVNMMVNLEAAQQAGTLTVTKASEGGRLDVNLLGVTSDDLTTEHAVALVQGVSSEDHQLAVTGNVNEGFVNGALTIYPDGSVTTHGNQLMAAVWETASVSTTLLDRVLTNDLRKRMGDLRAARGEHGLWFRWDSGRFKGNSGLSNNFHTAQIGADTTAGQNVRLGVAAEFTYGNMDHSRGRSDLEGITFAGYSVWMTENGLYTDIVGRVGSFKADMKVDGYKGKLDTHIASLSSEVGWRLPLNELFYVEPQLELSYTHINSDNFNIGPARYNLDDTDSLIGRTGLAASFVLPNNRGDIYTRASVVRQFMGDGRISGHVNGVSNTDKLDGDDTWFEYGIGINIFLTDSIYGWANVERTSGAIIDEEWRGTVSLRYTF